MWSNKNTMIIAVLTIVFGATALSLWSEWSSYHNFEGQCLTCHLTNPAEGQEKYLFIKEISALCISCHSEAVRLSHPVDIKPSMTIPKDFTLDRKGNLTCNSCHTTHKTGYGKYHMRTSTAGIAFCEICHQGIVDGMPITASVSAHLGGSTGSRFTSWGQGGYLDELSIECLLCHDGSVATDALVEKPLFAGEYDHTNNIGLSHPIGVSHREATEKYFGAYRKIEKLPQEIRLFDGKVGCVSCHNPYSKLPFNLSMSNEGSALCLACHVK